MKGPLICAVCKRLASACRITDGNDHQTVPIEPESLAGGRETPPEAFKTGEYGTVETMRGLAVWLEKAGYADQAGHLRECVTEVESLAAGGRETGQARTALEQLNGWRELGQEMLRILACMPQHQRDDLLPDWFPTRLIAFTSYNAAVLPPAAPTPGPTDNDEVAEMWQSPFGGELFNLYTQNSFRPRMLFSGRAHVVREMLRAMLNAERAQAAIRETGAE